MPTPASLKVAPTDHGCVIRIEGRGTMKESPAASTVANQTLSGDPNAVVVFDLSACSYLDSTFLGCITGLYGHYGRAPAARFFVAGSAEKRKALLGTVKIDSLIPSVPEAPPMRGEWVTIPIDPVDQRDLSRHVMECHRVLAQADSPMRSAFAKIADQLERELAKIP
jgi:anti-anti-sigma regulatory factor